MFRSLAALAVAGLLVACDEVVVSDTPSTPTPTATPQTTSGGLSARQAALAFVEVTRRVEPVAERECQARTQGVNCDFRILVDDRPNQPVNAYQTLDENDRPLIVFTIGLIESARNADELAFVMGHEAAHHIRGHIPRQQQNAVAGAALGSVLATLWGGDAASVRNAQRAGAQVGARSYSKAFELEADELGTILTLKSGYNALRGAEFFNRIPDPGDRFLGTHPPNAQRIQKVRTTVAAY